MKKIYNAFTTVIVLVVVVLAVALVGVRVFGYTPYVILSPSMSPVYRPGDLVYVKKAPAAEIQTGDVITFVANAELTVVTHRVDEVGGGHAFFYTKGDANETRDVSEVSYENVLGVVRFSVPKLGYVSQTFTGKSGRFAALAVGFFLLLLLLLPELFPAKKKVSDEASDESDRDIAGNG